MKNQEIEFNRSSREHFSNHIFDWKWYKVYYNFDFDGEDEALLHFDQFGFASDLDPSPLVSTSFIKRYGPSYGWTTENATSLLGTLDSVVAGSNFGWSPRIIPSWISAQIGMSEEEANRTLFTDVLNIVKGGSITITPHPGILPTVEACEGRMLSEVLTSTIQNDHISEYTIFDLKKYTLSYKDLRAVLCDGEAFDHLWSTGLSQNRLKYLGFSAPKWMNYDTLLRHVFSLHLAPKIQAKAVDEDRLFSKMPLISFSISEDSRELVDVLASYSGQENPNPLGFYDLFKISKIANGKSNKIIKMPENKQNILFHINLNRNLCMLDSDLFSSQKRTDVDYVVYSVNLGQYDYVPTPPNLENCCYYLITDTLRVDSNFPWRIVRPTIVERDLKRLCLWYKTHPHLLFPEAKSSIWIDSNVNCLPGSEKIIQAQDALAEVATFVHPDRYCVYKEAEAIIELGLDRPEVILDVVEQMRLQGMPEEHGLFETNVLYSKSRDYAVIRFMNKWWRNIFFGSRRDQMSFTFAAYQTGIEISPLEGRNCTKNSRYFSKQPHRYLGGRIVETF
jgi:hypothetical protein